MIVVAFRRPLERYLVDDAYISFQYAKSLVAGDGLVFNPGERVEGYSNFLWTMGAALPLAFDLDPGLASQVVAMVLLAAIFVLAYLVCHHPSSPAHQDRPLRSFFYLFILLVATPNFVAISLSGLEVSLYCLLIPLFGYLLFLRDPAGRGWRLGIAVAAVCLLLTRMESALLIGAGAPLFLLRTRSEDGSWWLALRRATEAFAPPAAIYAAYLVWRWVYYGELLPNTYYAKVAYAWHFEAGLVYLLTMMRYLDWCLFLLVPFVLVACVWVARRLRTARGRTPFAWFMSFCVVTVFVHLGYVVKVGGDFMDVRFLAHILPVIALLFWLGFRCVYRAHILFGALTALAIVTSLALVAPKAQPDMQTVDAMNRYYLEGVRAGRLLQRSIPADTTLAARLAGTVRYYSGLPTIDMWGLNDRAIARKKAWQPTAGHNKHASDRYLLERGVELVVFHPVFCSWRAPCAFPEGYPSVFINAGGGSALRLRYLTPRRELTRLFLDHPDDFVLVDVPTYFLFDEPILFDFEDGVLPPSFERSGEAFDNNPVEGNRRKQGVIPSYQGRFVLSSFHPSLGDAATGSVTVARLRIEKSWLRLYVGGGGDARRLYVSLSDGDREVGRATGSGGERLMERSWNVSDYLGRELTFTIVDESSEKGGHLNVDAIYFSDHAAAPKRQAVKASRGAMKRRGGALKQRLRRDARP